MQSLSHTTHIVNHSHELIAKSIPFFQINFNIMKYDMIYIVIEWMKMKIKPSNVRKKHWKRFKQNLVIEYPICFHSNRIIEAYFYAM